MIDNYESNIIKKEKTQFKYMDIPTPTIKRKRLGDID